MIGVVATLKIAEGKEAEFETLAKDLITKVKANEPGVRTYQLYRSKTDASTYILMEEYDTQASLTAHGQTEYFKASQPGIGACLASAPDIQYYDSVD